MGPEKAYAEINKGGQFVDGEIYPIVQTLDGTNLANAIILKLVGKNMSDAQDVDGKVFVKDMTVLASKQASFWYDFKFVKSGDQEDPGERHVLRSCRFDARLFRPLSAVTDGRYPTVRRGCSKPSFTNVLACWKASFAPAFFCHDNKAD